MIDRQVVLPSIPEKKYFTIGEVAKLCEVKTHVLRYWEQEFSELKPVKRRGNRRYYQRSDLLLIRAIRRLLHDEGFTIEGAKHKLKDREPSNASRQNDGESGVVWQVIQELEGILLELNDD